MNPYVTVRVDLDRIRANVRAIAHRTKVPILAVIKAQAYGLGSAQVAKAIAPIVEGFCIFQLPEAIEIDLYRSTAIASRIRVSGLGDAVHTIKILVLGTKNSASHGTGVSIDRFVVG